MRLPAVPAIEPTSIPWLSIEQMVEADRLAIDEFGIELLQMMEHAGSSLAELVTRLAPEGAVTVLALGWGVRAPARPLLVAPAVVAGAACFLAIGASVAGATGNPRSAQGVASAVFFPLLFLSGAMFPLDAFPPALQVLARALPGYHLHELLAYTWFGSASPPWPSITYLLAGTTVVTGGAVLLFRGREDL